MASLPDETRHGLVPSDSSNLTLAALQTMLTHGSEYLHELDLGHLSICSKTVSNMTEETGAWKCVFEAAAAAGQVCKNEVVPFLWHKDHPKVTWNGEAGMLECFAKPSPQVLASVGYKHAARCLLTKTCFLCGKMAGNANPITMMRTCDGCADSNESMWIIAKSKAKEAFLLSEKDCSSFRSAPVPFSLSGKPGEKAKTSVVFLISDVKEASFAKHGGADGLATEFAKRKTAAASGYNKSQSTNKPQKKRPKIARLSDRPADDLASLRYFFGMSLPIPTVFAGHFGPVKMTHSAKCKVCNARGTIRDIVMHERVEHTVLVAGHWVVPEPCPPYEDVSLSIPANIKPAEELVQLLASADIQHEFGTKNNSWDDRCVSEKFNSTFTFGDCKVVIDCDKFIGTEIDMNLISILYQTGPATLPVYLLRVERGEAMAPFDEASKKCFENLKAALGLQKTSSTQLLAALISRAVSVEDFLDSYCEDDPSEADYPIIHGAWSLLKACHESSSE